MSSANAVGHVAPWYPPPMEDGMHAVQHLGAHVLGREVLTQNQLVAHAVVTIAVAAGAVFPPEHASAGSSTSEANCPDLKLSDEDREVLVAVANGQVAAEAAGRDWKSLLKLALLILQQFIVVAFILLLTTGPIFAIPPQDSLANSSASVSSSTSAVVQDTLSANLTCSCQNGDWCYCGDKCGCRFDVPKAIGYTYGHATHYEHGYYTYHSGTGWTWHYGKQAPAPRYAPILTAPTFTQFFSGGGGAANCST